MTDEAIESVGQEIANPEAEISQVSNVGSKEYNFAQLRQQKEQLERELERERQEKLYLMQMNQQKHFQEQPQEQEFDWNSLNTEDFIEGKKVAQAFGYIQKKVSEKDQKIQLLEAALNNKDFHEVVTDENIKKYIMNDPDYVEAIKTASNPGQRLYKLIKNHKDYQADMIQKNKPSMTPEQRKVIENDTKPKQSSMGIRSDAVKVAARYSEMSKEDRAKIWQETQKLARQAR